MNKFSESMPADTTSARYLIIGQGDIGLAVTNTLARQQKKCHRFSTW